MVSATGNSTEFHRRDVIQDIINSRLDHLSTKFWTEDEKRYRETGRAFTFDDLLVEVQKWLVILGNKGINEKVQTNSGQTNKNNKTANVNSTTTKGKKDVQAAQQEQATTNSTTSMASHIANSPKQQQSTTRCGICDSIHETSDCHILVNSSVDDRIKKLGEKGLCYHCLQSGHTARYCTQRPACNVCKKPHNTLMHREKMVYNQNRSTAPNNIPLQQLIQNPPPTHPYAPMSATAPPPHGPSVQAPAPSTHPII